MNVTDKKGHILYFEYDQVVSQSTIDCLKQENYQITHFSEFPKSGIEALKSTLEDQPDVVILDINMPGLDGYKVCKILKEEYLNKKTPILFISENVSEEDILRAYDSGANDFLRKPVRLKELLIKLEKYLVQKEQLKSNQAQMNIAQKMAFDAMTTSSELGEILRFHEALHSINTISALAKSVLAAISKFSLTSSIMLFTDNAEYFSIDGKNRPLEEKVLQAYKGQARIYSWKDKTFFNYDYFSVIIKDMPIGDELRYGILKDQLCILLNGVDARVRAIMIQDSNAKKAVTMKIAADTIANMVMEIENDNIELSQNFEQIILKLECNIAADIIQFNLLENEEKVLMEHVMLAIKESSAVFENSIDKEKQYKSIMNRLLKDLMSDK